jgi:hypothetical protein
MEGYTNSPKNHLVLVSRSTDRIPIGSTRAQRDAPRCSSVTSRTARSSKMSFSRRQRRAAVRLRLEQLESRFAPAVLTPTTFAEAGRFFNDATRRLEGGLWQIAVQESNQPTGFVVRYQTDLTNVRDTINAEMQPGGDLSGVPAGSTTAAHLATILADLNGAIALAPASVSFGLPTFVSAPAQTAIRHAHLQILNIVKNDDTLADLAALAPAGAGVGFKAVPPKLSVPLEDAPHATFDQIGKIFNDAANRIIGGLGSEDNTEAIRADISVMTSSLTALAQGFQGRPGVDQQLARIHILVIRDQTPLWVRFIDTVNTNPVAPKGSNDRYDRRRQPGHRRLESAGNCTACDLMLPSRVPSRPLGTRGRSQAD